MTCFGPDEALTGAGITTCRRGFAHRCFCALGFSGGFPPFEAFPGEVDAGSLSGNAANENFQRFDV